MKNDQNFAFAVKDAGHIARQINDALDRLDIRGRDEYYVLLSMARASCEFSGTMPPGARNDFLMAAHDLVESDFIADETRRYSEKLHKSLRLFSLRRNFTLCALQAVYRYRLEHDPLEMLDEIKEAYSFLRQHKDEKPVIKPVHGYIRHDGSRCNRFLKHFLKLADGIRQEGYDSRMIAESFLEVALQRFFQGRRGGGNPSFLRDVYACLKAYHKLYRLNGRSAAA